MLLLKYIVDDSGPLACIVYEGRRMSCLVAKRGAGLRSRCDRRAFQMDCLMPTPIEEDGDQNAGDGVD